MADASDVLEDVRGVGADTRAAVLERYSNLQELALTAEDELTEIRGVGPATARAIKAAVSAALESEASADLADPDELTPASAVATATSAPEPDTTERRDTGAAPPRPPLERVRRDLDETLSAMRDAGLAVGGVLVAAVSAARERLPEVAENLRDASASLSRTATDLLSAVRGGRERGS